MENKELSRLISKFYDGESSGQEEQLLRALFSGDQIPQGFLAEREYILFCLKNGTIKEASDNFEEKIMMAIDIKERVAMSMSGRRRYLVLLSGAAAAILMLIGSYFFMESRRELNDTYSDPEIAYAETMKILFDVSSRLNRGSDALAPVSKLNSMAQLSLEKINESSSMINRSFIKVNDVIKLSSEESKKDTGVITK